MTQNTYYVSLFRKIYYFTYLTLQNTQYSGKLAVWWKNMSSQKTLNNPCPVNYVADLSPSCITKGHVLKNNVKLPPITT